MYDVINGFQVKCFKTPNFYEGELCYSSGSLDSYCNGEKVPTFRPYKIFPLDFIIVTDGCVHFIENGKVLKSVKQEDYSMLSEDEIKKYRFFENMGIEIKISCVKDFNNYCNEKCLMLGKISSILKPTHSLLHKAGQIRRNESPYDKNSIEENDILFKETIHEYDTLRPTFNEELENVQNTFKEKWYIPNIYKDFETFGALLTLYEEEKDDCDKLIIEEQMKVFHDKDKEFLTKYQSWVKGEL